MEPDFAGYVTHYDVECSDGATIKPGAFKHFHGKQVPLVFMHDHKSIENVLGHVALEHRDNGLYGRVFLNDTPNAKLAKQQVAHGDMNQFSIWANELVGRGKDILHGVIREVSLVLSGANKLALIDWVNPSLSHDQFSQFEDEEALIITSGLIHMDLDEEDEGDDSVSVTTEKRSVKEIFDEMTEEQKDAVASIAAELLSAEDDESEESDESGDSDDDDESDEDTDDGDNTDSVEHSDLEGDNSMTRNVFEQAAGEKPVQKVLSHDAMKTIFSDAQKMGSLQDSILAHAEDYGIQDIESLFPEVRDVYNPPEFLKRDTGWVAGVLAACRKLPFSKIRTRFADIREDEARAKGYMKGNLKKEEVFTLLKRTTSPATIYKKQKLDRDDIIDITDFDVVAWIRAEMRLMLEEELARAILVGDGRPSDHEDKIKDPVGAQDGVGIRSIAHDDEFYAERVEVTPPLASAASGDAANVTAFVDDMVRARRKWKGTGTPTFYTTVDVSSELLLGRDTLGRRYYETVGSLSAGMLVSNVVDVEVLEEYPNIVGILVNLADYSIGATKGGELTSFDDFDIDYNQYKYLLETRLSGALTRWKAALVFVTSEFEQGESDPRWADEGGEEEPEG